MSASGRPATAGVTQRLPAFLRPSEGGLNPGLVAALIVLFVLLVELAVLADGGLSQIFVLGLAHRSA